MALIRIFCIVFSIIVNVNSQTCDSTTQYSSCSTNSACGCLPIAFADEIGICGLMGVSCSRLNPCQSDDTCQSVDHICIHHPRCSSDPLCYPLAMLDQRLCPPMITTTTRPTTVPFFTTEARTAVPFFTTEARTAVPLFTTETTTTVTGTTDYDSDYFNSSLPADSIISNYSNQLTTSNAKLPNTNTYYQVIEILVNTSGYYDIRSLSNIDTYGCLYHGNYSPSSSSNQITCNDDYTNGQFRLASFLEAGVTYSLLFTTYGPGVTGPYSVVVYGPGEVEFNTVDAVHSATTEFYENFTTATEISNSSVFSNYSSELTNSSEKYPGSRKYYEAIQIMVNTSGFYTLSSVENIDGFGYLYQSYFNSSNQAYNLIAQDDQSGGNDQFRIQVYLQAGVSYTLVFTTYQENIIGSFSIVASGPSEVEFSLISTLQTTMTPPADVTTDYSYEITENYSGEFLSNYSSELTSNSEKHPGFNNYYEAIKIMVNTSGVYTFKSEQNMNGYLYLYYPYFNPSYASQNLYASSGPLSRSDSIRIQLYLQAGISYTLVCAADGENTIGMFLIVASGPSAVEFQRLSTLQEITTPPADVTTDYSYEITENHMGELIISNYSSELTLNSRVFARSGGSGPKYYYEAIQINVYSVGTYRIISQSIASDSYMDTTNTYEFATQSYNSQGNIDAYGYIYQHSFDPSNPTMNLLANDDDNAGNGQFGLTVYLQPDITYVLVFTTYRENTIGPFTIVASGPDYLVLYAATDITSK